MQMRIPRRFAMDAKEVTIEQYERFLKVGRITIGDYQPSLNKFSPDPDGPWIAPNWYMAAEYCNWLSEQEGLPKDQWCYLPNEAGVYRERMSIPADVLERTGYRLPTEAEWEYACRAGAVTSRYYGHSLDLLDAYAWYQSNSKEHAWTDGTLFSNDLGLFDMLGNLFEWCQDNLRAPKPLRNGINYNIVITHETIVERHIRIIRGGSFLNRPSHMRSALRNWFTPNDRSFSHGFRPARTYR
jgi:formylglycine-generating enzyme required for sulfatase activity